MSKHSVQRCAASIQLVGGLLDGANRTIFCSPDVEALARPLLVFHGESLREIRHRWELKADASYIVYRLERNSSNWRYVYTDITSREAIRRNDFAELIRGMTTLVCTFLLAALVATITIMFIKTQSKSTGGPVNPLRTIDWRWDMPARRQ